MNRGKGLLLVLAGVVVSGWYLVRFEGEPNLVDPLLVTRLPETHDRGTPPTLLQNINEPAAIYLVSGLPGPDGRFGALRLDVNSGARSTMRIRFGPDTAFLPYDSAEVTGFPAVEFHGVTLRRPTFHLLTFPGPGGPGFHLVDSATGVMQVVLRTGNTSRLLLTRSVINSSRMPEMRTFLWVDRSRKLAAFLWPEADRWTLTLFSLIPPQT